VRLLWEPEVSAVEIQQVKGDEHALTSAEKQIAKHWSACMAHASNLAIEDSTFKVEIFGDPCREIREAVENVSVSGDHIGG